MSRCLELHKTHTDKGKNMDKSKKESAIRCAAIVVFLGMWMMLSVHCRAAETGPGGHGKGHRRQGRKAAGRDRSAVTLPPLIIF